MQVTVPVLTQLLELRELAGPRQGNHAAHGTLQLHTLAHSLSKYRNIIFLQFKIVLCLKINIF